MEITMSKSKKYNTGNYTSRDVFVAVKADPEGMAPEKVLKILNEQLDNAILREEQQVWDDIT